MTTTRTNPASLPAASQRRWEIDALRGLMLVLMLLTHLPTRLTSAFGQPLGFVSAAEGFVLLSAYMAGLVYGKLAWQRGPADMRRAFWRRAVKIYGCQVSALLFLFTVIAFIGLSLRQPAVTNLMSFYLHAPVTAIASSLLLIYQPPLLDILPLYIVFMLLGPWLLSLAHRRGWTMVMGASVLLWLLTQFGLSEWLYNGFAAVFSLSVPYQESGAFSIWAWQLIWMLGLWMGASRHEPAAPPFTFPRWSVRLAGIVFLVGLSWRHSAGQVPFNEGTLNLLFDKWQLGPLRLINLFAVLVLVIRFGGDLARWLPRQRWLETLGAASLSVFCTHLAVVLLVLGVLGDDFERPWALDLPILVVSIAILYVTARIRLHWKHRPTPWAKPTDSSPAPPSIPAKNADWSGIAG